VQGCEHGTHVDRIAFAPIVMTAPSRQGTQAAPAIKVVVGILTVRVPVGADLSTLQVVLHAEKLQCHRAMANEYCPSSSTGARLPSIRARGGFLQTLAYAAAGHLAALGLNVQRSLRRLRGPHRPSNGHRQRMSVSANACPRFEPARDAAIWASRRWAIGDGQSSRELNLGITRQKEHYRVSYCEGLYPAPSLRPASGSSPASAMSNRRPPGGAREPAHEASSTTAPAMRSRSTKSREWVSQTAEATKLSFLQLGFSDAARCCTDSLAELVARDIQNGEAPPLFRERLEVGLDENLYGLFAGRNPDANRRLAKVNLVAPPVPSSNDGVWHYGLASKCLSGQSVLIRQDTSAGSGDQICIGLSSFRTCRHAVAWAIVSAARIPPTGGGGAHCKFAGRRAAPRGTDQEGHEQALWQSLRSWLATLASKRRRR